MVTSIQCKSAPSGYRMSCLAIRLHAILPWCNTAGTSHLTIFCPIGLMRSPLQVHLLERHLVGHAKRSYGPSKLSEKNHLPRPPLSFLGSWFFKSPDVGFWAAVVL